MSQYGEPWRLHNIVSYHNSVVDSAGKTVIEVDGNGMDDAWLEFEQPKMARMLACVNACRHLPQDFLESLGENGLDAVNLTLAQEYVPRRKLEITNG